MNSGFIGNLEAVVSIEIGAESNRQLLSATMDTGYNGHLTLPTHIIQSLGLTEAGKLLGMLTEGTMISINSYLAEIRWLGSVRKVVVAELECGPLIGMALLDGCRITFDVIEDGSITIESLRPPA